MHLDPEGNLVIDPNSPFYDPKAFLDPNAENVVTPNEENVVTPNAKKEVGAPNLVVDPESVQENLSATKENTENNAPIDPVNQEQVQTPQAQQEPLTQTVIPPTLSDEEDDANATNTASSSSDPFANTKPLNLSQSDVEQGSVKKLEGTWKVKSPLIDANSGKPVNLEYSFDANGKGKATIMRQNGVKCITSVDGKIVSGQLQIENEAVAICSDKSSYTMPRIKCAPWH